MNQEERIISGEMEKKKKREEKKWEKKKTQGKEEDLVDTNCWCNKATKHLTIWRHLRTETRENLFQVTAFTRQGHTTFVPTRSKVAETFQGIKSTLRTLREKSNMKNKSVQSQCTPENLRERQRD